MIYRISSKRNSETQLLLSLQAFNLKSNSGRIVNPIILCLSHKSDSNELVELGRTEIAKAAKNPKFNEKICINFTFQEVQKLEFEFFNATLQEHFLKAIETQPHLIRKWESLGKCNCQVARLIKCMFEPMVLSIQTQSSDRTIHMNQETKIQTQPYLLIKAEELAPSKDMLDITIRIVNVFSFTSLLARRAHSRMCMMRYDEEPGKTPSVVPIVSTHIIRNTMKPRFEVKYIPIADLTTNGRFTDKFKFVFLHKSSKHYESLIGEVPIDLQTLFSKNSKLVFPLQKKKRKDTLIKTGYMIVERAVLTQGFTFVDYCANGLNLNFSIAIDFSDYNGIHRDPSSLHYKHPLKLKDNPYQTSLKAIGRILIEYDEDKRFPIYGFGAQPNESLPTSQSFPLNGKPGAPEVSGMQGIMTAYEESVDMVIPNQVSKLHEVIDNACNAAALCSAKDYLILLIITNGNISDKLATKHSIIQAAQYPFSIVIIGVGSFDFAFFHELDADSQPLRTYKATASRDLVQFVCYKEFIKYYRLSAETFKAKFAACVLEEIPDQITEYMLAAGYFPERTRIKNQTMSKEPKFL